MTAPFMMIAPMPTSTWSPIVAPWITAPWPTDTPSPRSTGLPLSTWNAQLSCTFDRAPIVIGSLSARSTAPYQMLAPSPITTDPARVALGATHAVSATLWGLVSECDEHAPNVPTSVQLTQLVMGSIAK